MRITTTSRSPAAKLLTSMLLPLLLLLALPFEEAEAQDTQDTTFTVTVATKTDDHPRFGEGFAQGFVIDEDQGKELTLTPGVTYTFQMQDVPAIHPFYITTSEVGAGAEAYTEGVTNNFASGNDTLTFTPPDNAPEVLYYQCQNHAYMGWRINLMSATPTEAGAALPESFEVDGNYPNPFNPSTTIRFDLPRPADVHLEVFDVTGRRVASRSVRALPAGADQTLQFEAAPLASGSYLYRVIADMADGTTQARSGVMLLLK